MSEHLSGVDDAQLERWAYGRATTPAEQERSGLASAELQRRAALERERAERAEAERASAEAHSRAIANGEVDDTASEHPDPWADSEHRHRRRMLATGISGLVAAALALVGGIVVLNQPNLDPLAIFERQETEADREWAQILALDPETTFTAGPRVFRDDDGIIGLVARVSTVPDGRSTAWDAYCLYVGRELGDGSLSITNECTYPEQFAASGLSVIERGSSNGDGYDTAIWGPIGDPRVEKNMALDDTIPAPSVLDLLANPLNGFEEELDALSIVDEPDRLLMGPRLANQSALIAGEPLVVQLYLLEGLTETPEPEPELCMHVSHGRPTPVTVCSPLRNAQSSGLLLQTVIADEIWTVIVDVTGTVRAEKA